MMQKDTFNRTLDFNSKLKYFFAAWALIEIVLGDALNKFINVLNYRHVLHLPQGFDGSQIIWGDSIPLNIIKIAITCSFACGFGITYSYLARKVVESDKAALSIANAVMSVFGTLLLTVAIYWVIAIFQGTDAQIHQALVTIATAIRENGLYAFLVVANFVGGGIFTFIGLSIGQNLIQDIDEEDKGRLLGVKWYHYLWLWFAIGIYVEAVLYLIYMTIHAIGVFLGTFHWFDIFGATSGDKPNSLDALGGAIFFSYIIAVFILYLMNLLRETLSGERNMNVFGKIGIGILVALVIPILLLVFTAIGTSSSV